MGVTSDVCCPRCATGTYLPGDSCRVTLPDPAACGYGNSPSGTNNQNNNDAVGMGDDIDPQFGVDPIEEDVVDPEFGVDPTDEVEETPVTMPSDPTSDEETPVTMPSDPAADTGGVDPLPTDEVEETPVTMPSDPDEESPVTMPSDPNDPSGPGEDDKEEDVPVTMPSDPDNNNVGMGDDIDPGFGVDPLQSCTVDTDCDTDGSEYCGQGTCVKHGQCITDDDCVNPANMILMDKKCVGYQYCDMETKFCDRKCGEPCSEVGARRNECAVTGCDTKIMCPGSVNCVPDYCNDCQGMYFNSSGYVIEECISRTGGTGMEREDDGAADATMTAMDTTTTDEDMTTGAGTGVAVGIIEMEDSAYSPSSFFVSTIISMIASAAVMLW